MPAAVAQGGRQCIAVRAQRHQKCQWHHRQRTDPAPIGGELAGRDGARVAPGLAKQARQRQGKHQYHEEALQRMRVAQHFAMVQEQYQ
ncbi:hypothetical protein Xcc3_35570 [Xanthomonas campestris pv. campestris]|nr:hypothetical protein Xcc3_35570 [Xanthomonas campestris pv. campestris]